MYPIHFFDNDDRLFSFHIFFPVGSIYETKANHGISHFLEHIKFKRSKEYDGDEILSMLEAKGTVYNAYTTKDHTCYYIRTLEEHYKLGLRMLCEIAFNTQFSRNDIDVERKVVLEEFFKTTDSSMALIWDMAETSILSKSNPYFKNVIGREASLRKMNNHQLLAFHRQFYLDSFYIVVHCSPRKQQRIREDLENQLSRLRVHVPHALQSISLVPPLKNTNQMEYSINLFPAATSQNTTVLTFASYPRSDPRSYALDFISYYLSSGLMSVLGKEIREKRGLVYTIQTEYNNYSHIGFFHIFFATSHRDIVDIVKTLFSVMYSAARKLTLPEYDKKKSAFLDYITYSSKQSSALEFLSRESFYNKGFSYDMYKRYIERLKRRQFVQLWMNSIDPHKMGIMSIGAYKDVNTSLNDIEQAIKQIKQDYVKEMKRFNQ